MRTRRTVVLALVLAGALAGCGVADPTADGWVFPTPYPLPSGAVAVPIQNIRVPRPIPADVEVAGGCPLMPIDPFVIEYRAGEATPVWYRFPAVTYQTVIWPTGVSARLNPGLEIVGVDGTIIAREGVWTSGWHGGFIQDALFVCAGAGSPTGSARRPATEARAGSGARRRRPTGIESRCSGKGLGAKLRAAWGKGGALVDGQVQRLQAWFTSYGDRDRGTMLDSLADDAVWHVGGTHRLSGDYRGRDAILGYFDDVRRETGDTMQLEPLEVMANDRHGAAFLRVTAERGGRHLDTVVADAFRFDEEGRIVEFWACNANQSAINEFWS